jgi:hypothetical protein
MIDRTGFVGEAADCLPNVAAKGHHPPLCPLGNKADSNQKFKCGAQDLAEKSKWRAQTRDRSLVGAEADPTSNIVT